jgi:hypothetical protein
VRFINHTVGSVSSYCFEELSFPYGDVRRKIVTGDDKIHKNYVDCSLTGRYFFLDWTSIPTRE